MHCLPAVGVTATIAAFTFSEHVDVQYTLEQWEATPRQCIVSFFIWLADANPRRAPLMVRIVPFAHELLLSVSDYFSFPCLISGCAVSAIVTPHSRQS